MAASCTTARREREEVWKAPGTELAPVPRQEGRAGPSSLLLPTAYQSFLVMSGTQAAHLREPGLGRATTTFCELLKVRYQARVPEPPVPNPELDTEQCGSQIPTERRREGAGKEEQKEPPSAPRRV